MLVAMIDECVFILINLSSKNLKTASLYMGKINLTIETFDYLENKILILGDFRQKHRSGFLQRRLDYFFCFKYLLRNTLDVNSDLKKYMK